MASSIKTPARAAWEALSKDTFSKATLPSTDSAAEQTEVDVSIVSIDDI
jgi:hypothetical protein